MTIELSKSPHDLAGIGKNILLKWRSKWNRCIK
jgi:hypothetical protein